MTRICVVSFEATILGQRLIHRLSEARIAIGLQATPAPTNPAMSSGRVRPSREIPRSLPRSLMPLW